MNFVTFTKGQPMSNEFKIIKPEELHQNPFSSFGNDWPLLTAGRIESYNGMTIGWGGFGVLWSKNVATVYVRPQRYTFQFLEREPYFGLSFLNSSYKDALNFFGSKSGRDVDKAKETGLTPKAFEDKTVYFEEADLVIVLKKIYADDFDKSKFISFDPQQIYPEGDYHRFYIGEIVGVLSKK